MGVRGDAADLIEQAEAGMTCTPEDSESIAQTAMALYNLSPDQRIALGENGKSFYDREMSLSTGVSKFEKIFVSVDQNK
jgi:hypothetical protein